MNNTLDAWLPSFQEIQKLINDAAIVRLQLSTGIWLKGRMSWQDEKTIYFESLCQTTYLCYKQSIVCISFAADGD